jgi:cytochrome P450 family 9
MALGAVLIGLLVVALALLYLYGTRSYSYWSEKGVEYIKPYPFVVTMWRVFILNEHLGDYFVGMAKNFKGQRFGG